MEKNNESASAFMESAFVVLDLKLAQERMEIYVCCCSVLVPS